MRYIQIIKIMKISSIIRYLNNALEFIRKGGVVQVNIQRIDQGQVLEGKNILITGGTSGLGLEMASKFIESGARVLVTSRSAVNLESARVKINNPNLFVLEWDVSNLEILRTKFAASVEILGSIDILVNNAGVATNVDFMQSDVTIWDSTINTNLKAVFFISQCACKYFMSNPNADKSQKKILNISSVTALNHKSEPNAYHISKAGVDSLTTGLAKSYTKHGIIVNGIAPGFASTSMNPMNPKENAYLSKNLHSRIILPEEVAELALFLISDASSSIIGQTILIDGGFSIS